jgi:hypothetical protein
MKRRFLNVLCLALIIYFNRNLCLEKLNAEGIAPYRTTSVRISNTKAQKLIEKWFFDQPTLHGLIDKGQKFPVKEVTPNEVWKELKGQIFEVDEKQNIQLNAGDAFFVKNTKVYHLGFNIKEYCIADLNKDGILELVFVRSIPGDICFDAQLGVFSEAFSGSKLIVQKSIYSCGDFHLKKLNRQSVEVDVNDYVSFSFNKKTALALGRVGLLNHDGQKECGINFYEHLPPKTMEKFYSIK